MHTFIDYRPSLRNLIKSNLKSNILTDWAVTMFENRQFRPLLGRKSKSNIPTGGRLSKWPKTTYSHAVEHNLGPLSN